MILVDSVYINRSGSKLLLDDLIAEIHDRRIDVFYLFDARVADTYDFIEPSRKGFIPATIWARTKYYQQNIKKFNTVFCFGGVPPLVHSKAKVLCYFHNIALMDFRGLKFKDRLFRALKFCYLKLSLRNVYLWVVQTEYVKFLMHDRLGVPPEKVIVLPFFKSYDGSHGDAVITNSFIYVSDAYEHKNHERLFKAFERLQQRYTGVSLFVTVSVDKTRFTELIDRYRARGISITNLGFTGNADIGALYNKMECVVFPSYLESLGLGLLEAAQFHKPVIASDLGFTHAAIKPSLTFDPFSVDSIYSALETYLTSKKNIQATEVRLKNQLKSLVDLISYNQ